MPRKYPPSPSHWPGCTRCFNEAGADAPEIPPQEPIPNHLQVRFNEAGADAPEIPNRNTIRHRPPFGASMRPGRMPRKYPVSQFFAIPLCPGFNEAGADAPEIPVLDLPPIVVGGEASMRPGRMPRKYRHYFMRPGAPVNASMRPGRMPRKYRAKCPSLNHWTWCFNEAGADAPEIPRAPSPRRPDAGTLQ